MSSKRNIVIIGAGVAGLTAGLFYALDGYNVVVLEKNKYPGGLLATDKIQIKGYSSFEIEYFYHHFFKKDKNLLRLLRFLGIQNHLVFRKVPTDLGIGYTFKEKVLLAVLLTLPTYRPIKYVRVGSVIDVKDSKGALSRLFKYKFYVYAPNVSLAWLWARLHARFRVRDLLLGERLGVLEPSSKVLLDALVDRFTKAGGKLITSYNVSSIKQIINDFKPNKIICTIPPRVCKELLGNNFLDWEWHVPDYIGAYNVVFFIKDPKYDRQKRVPYWTNLLPSKGSPFLVKVRQHVLNHSLPVGVIYVGGYAPRNSSIFSLSDDKLKYMALSVLNKNERNRLIGIRVYRTGFAQHVPTVGFYKNSPPFYLGSFKYANKRVDLELFSFGNIIPWDRGVNYAVYPRLLECL